MKNSISLLLILVLTNHSFAQNQFHLSNDSDTAFWYNLKNEYASQFNLGLIGKDTTDYSFRFWSFGLVIKVAGKGNKNLGEIIRFVEAYPKDKKRIFTKRYSISSTQVLQIRHLIDSLQILNLPSDKNILGWQHGLDGITYFTEYKMAKLYSFKNYWTPTLQDSLIEAMQFQAFVLGLDRILDLKSNAKNFEANIPFESWHYPGSSSAAFRIKTTSRKKHGG